ncbi:hypothetical protein LDENG_00231530 [Lucifuga dentata]|nr:hypothetical protein LDENG_00231530 [Lucifuga dentata]
MLGSLCTLIAALTHVDAVIVLTQTPAVHTVSAGQEVVLNCNIQRDAGNYVSWYKQIPGGVPQYVLMFYHSHSSPSFGSGFSSDRFSSKSSSSIDYQFIIKRAEAGDCSVFLFHMGQLCSCITVIHSVTKTSERLSTALMSAEQNQSRGTSKAATKQEGC